jgi:hypothetical protein
MSASSTRRRSADSPLGASMRGDRGEDTSGPVYAPAAGEASREDEAMLVTPGDVRPKSERRSRTPGPRDCKEVEEDEEVAIGTTPAGCGIVIAEGAVRPSGVPAPRTVPLDGRDPSVAAGGCIDGCASEPFPYVVTNVFAACTAPGARERGPGDVPRRIVASFAATAVAPAVAALAARVTLLLRCGRAGGGDAARRVGTGICKSSARSYPPCSSSSPSLTMSRA